MSRTLVLALVAGRAVALADVPDPVFSQGMVGYGAAVDPPTEIIDAVAPVSGKILKLLPHAFVIMTPDSVGVLVHLGLDTVQLHGVGFVAHVAEGDTVTAKPGGDHLRRARHRRRRIQPGRAGSRHGRT